VKVLYETGCPGTPASSTEFLGKEEGKTSRKPRAEGVDYREEALNYAIDITYN
jgi:hypothetical protein